MPDVTRRVDLALQVRAAPIENVNAEERTADVVWAAGARVKRYDWERGRYYLEELGLNPGEVRLVRLNNGAPMLDTHNRWSLRDVLGVVEAGTAKVDGKRGVATVRFSKREEVEPIFRDVKDKIIVNVSVGYAVHRMSQTEEMVDGLPVYRAIDWEPMEISPVPIGADAGAGFRAEQQQRSYPCEFIDNPAAAPATPQPERTTEMTDEEKRAAEAARQKEEQDRRAAEEKARAEAVEAARVAERTRIAEIDTLCQRHGFDTAFRTALVSDDKATVEVVRAKVLEALAKRSEDNAIRSGYGDITTVVDADQTRHHAMVDACLLRHDPEFYRGLPDAKERSMRIERARQFRGMRLSELLRESLEAKNVRTRGMTPAEMWHRSLAIRTGSLGTSADFPNIVLDAANKTLRMAYENSPRTFVNTWARRASAQDFKNINRISLSDAPSLAEVKPSGEFTRGTMTDGKETYALATYGKIVGLTRQTIINDDLDAFTRIPMLFGRAAADLESDTVYGILTANGTMADTFALFGTGHSNLSTGAGLALGSGVSAISIGRTAIRRQTNLAGRPINVAPKFLIVPATLESVAEQFTSSQYVAAVQGNISPFSPGGRNPLVPVIEPRLDANSTAAWYLSADPAQIDTVEYAYLEGQEGVYTEERIGFEVDGVEIKVRDDFAAKAIEYRGLWKSNGA